jgi:hypothetical protein
MEVVVAMEPFWVRGGSGGGDRAEQPFVLFLLEAQPVGRRDFIGTPRL